MVSMEEIDTKHLLYDKMHAYRDSMISELANYCEDLEELYLTCELHEIPTEAIDNAIRKAIVTG